MDLDLLPLLDEQGHADLEAGLQLGKLGDAAARRITPNTWLRVGHCQFHVSRKLEADGAAVELLNLDDHIVRKQLPVLAHEVESKRERLEGLLVHEVEA